VRACSVCLEIDFSNLEITLYKIAIACNNQGMEDIVNIMPSHCPVCESRLTVTRLQCPSCGTEVGGNFSLSRLAGLREPYASLIEMFLRVRGNVKEMERELGLSYPTVRARLEEALDAAGLGRRSDGAEEVDISAERRAILEQLEQGEITAAEAQVRLRELQSRRTA
jgi:hypothetical protein